MQQSRSGWLGLAGIACLLLMAAALVFPASASAGLALQAAQPKLTIPNNIPSGPSSTVSVPIQLDPAGKRVSGVAFALRYDQSCLSLDLADANGDGTPDAIQFGALAAFNKSVSVRPTDPNATLIVVIADFSQPVAGLEAGSLLTITFGTRCAPAQGQTVYAPVEFGALPAPSFGSPDGRSLAGGVQGGGVLISDTSNHEPTATPTLQPTTTPDVTPSVTPSPTTTPPTPSPTPSPTASPTASPTPSPTPIVNGNSAPIARFDPAGTLQGHPVLIAPLTNDHDPNNDAMTLVSVADPAGGAVQIDAQGALLYTPDAGFSGFDSFSYLIRDPNGAPGLGYAGVVVSNARNHGVPPALLVATPGQAVTATVTISPATTVDLFLPADAYQLPGTPDEDVFFLAYLNWQRPAADVNAVGGDLRYTNRGFTLQAYISQHGAPDTVLDQPLQVTLHYANSDVSGLDASQLSLLRWDLDAGQWADGGMTMVECDPVHQQLVATVVRPGNYAWFAPLRAANTMIYAPAFFRNDPPLVFPGTEPNRLFLPWIMQY